jgi:hypothetical protein
VSATANGVAFFESSGTSDTSNRSSTWQVDTTDCPSSCDRPSTCRNPTPAHLALQRRGAVEPRNSGVPDRCQAALATAVAPPPTGAVAEAGPAVLACRHNTGYATRAAPPEGESTSGLTRYQSTKVPPCSPHDAGDVVDRAVACRLVSAPTSKLHNIRRTSIRSRGSPMHQLIRRYYRNLSGKNDSRCS